MKTLYLTFLLIMAPVVIARGIDMKTDCSSEPDGTYLPDLLSCSHFYTCLKGHSYRIRCPQGQYFDETLDMCNSAYLVNCHWRHRLNDKRVENNSSKKDCNHHTTTSPTCDQENNVSFITTPLDTFSTTESETDSLTNDDLLTTTQSRPLTNSPLEPSKTTQSKLEIPATQPRLFSTIECEVDFSTTTQPKTLTTTECETDTSSTKPQKPSSTTEDKPESPTMQPPQPASSTSPSDSSTAQPTHKPTTTPKPRSCNDKGDTHTFANILRKSINISVSDEIKAKCNALPDGAFVGDPIDCAKYYVCLNKEPIEHCCEPGRGFDTDKFVCNFKELIKNCQVS